MAAGPPLLLPPQAPTRKIVVSRSSAKAPAATGAWRGAGISENLIITFTQCAIGSGVNPRIGSSILDVGARPGSHRPERMADPFSCSGISSSDLPAEKSHRPSPIGAVELAVSEASATVPRRDREPD